jgi:hypothetical protein
MKKITLIVLFLLSVLSYGQQAAVTVTELKVRNVDATTINFPWNVETVNVSITVHVSSTYNTGNGTLMVQYKRNSSISAPPMLPTNGADTNFVLPNGYNHTKTFKITLSRFEFDNSGGVVYVDYRPGNNLLTYKSKNIDVTKILDPISNNIISDNETISEGQSVNILRGSDPLGGNGTFTYAWQQKVGDGAWTNISGANGINYVPGVLTLTTSYRRIVSSAAPTLANTSNEVTITVIPVNPILNNVITINGPQIQGSTPTGGTGVYTYRWLIYAVEGEAPAISPVTTKDYTIPEYLYNFVDMNNVYIERQVFSGAKISTSNYVQVTRPQQTQNNVISSSGQKSIRSSARMAATSNVETNLSDLTVYPNPTTEVVNFATNFSTNKEIEIVVYSESIRNERSVFKGTVTPNQVVSWNIPSGYAKGIYFYKIRSGSKEVKTGKIIVQ